MTIQETLKKAKEKFNKAKIKNPHIDAEILLSGILKKEREFLLIHSEKKLTKLQSEKFNKLISRRIKGEPVAYLIGYKYFYGNKFAVNKDVLVPRPETEMFIQNVERITHNKKNNIIIDAGTGSGCIIISLAKSIKESSSGYPELDSYDFFGIDVSRKALKVAKKNAELNHVDEKIEFLHGDLLEPILKSKIQNLKYQIIITANLPYGWKEWKNNCSMDTIGLKFEPEIALYAEEKGLKLYRKLFQQIKILGAPCYALCEIDPRQSKLISKLIKKEFPRAKFEIKKDLAGFDRLVIIMIK